MAYYFTDSEIDAILSGFSEATWGGSTIYGIFNNGYAGVALHTGIVESSSPEFTCKSTDVSTAVHGDSIIINAVTYKIIGVQVQGDGFTILVLSLDQE
jgi:hypothetical protein